jgi:antitoxin component YwqK of YwqJK toxin-antitoxin module
MRLIFRVTFFFITILFLKSDLIAQFHVSKHEPVKVTFYYNAVWELTTAENYLYRREAYFDLTDMVFDGVYSDYNRDDKLIADGIYNHGVKSGIHTEYVNHAVKTKIEYSGNDFTIWEWSDGKTEGVKNGNGKFSMIYFYFISVDGRIIPKEGIIDGEFRNGRRVGSWIFHDLSKSKTDEETYVNGKFLKRVSYQKRDSVEMRERKSIYLLLNSLNTETLLFDKGSFSYLNEYFEKYVTYPASFTRNVTYPSGLKRLISLFSQAMMVPEEALELVRLKINVNGRIEKAAIVRSIDLTYDNLTDEILEIHKNRFFPAMKNGKPVAAVIYLPVASGERWMQALEGMPTEWFLDPNNFMN